MAKPSVTSLPVTTADEIRELITTGQVVPGQQLAEVELAAKLDISRNTLRESYRILAQEGLVRHIPNRGVFVSTPSPQQVHDLFHVRRLIESDALTYAKPDHPAVAGMRAAVQAARSAIGRQDWRMVGTQDIKYHQSIVRLADSPILDKLYGALAAQLRLMFGVLGSVRSMHEPYVERNALIVQLVENGDGPGAAKVIRNYLDDAQAQISAAYAASLAE